MSKRRNASVNPDSAPKREVRAEAKVTKKAGKVDLILAKAQLATAKASKRKALVALIVVALIAYYVLSSGTGSGILDKLKTFIPIGE